MGRRVATSLILLFVGAISACETRLDAPRFQRRMESVFMDVNAGFGIHARDASGTTFVRGDQLYVLPVGTLFTDYLESKASASDFFDRWQEKLEAEAKARRRTLAQSQDVVIPILKSGSWIKAHDLGAIGPRSVRDEIRGWRHQVAEDLYVLLGIPEALLGYRYASIAELGDSKIDAETWLSTAIENLEKSLVKPEVQEIHGNDGRLLVRNYLGIDAVAALILSRRFRQQTLRDFDRTELGASIPNRDVLGIFDNNDFVTVKPLRVRTRELYDKRNHPGFRGLLRFDADTISVLEPAYPEGIARR